MYLKVALVAFCFACAYAAPKNRVKKGDCTEEQLDKSDACFKRVLLLGDVNQKTPMTMKEMDEHCEMATKSVACFKAYNKCLKRMPKQIYSMLANNVNKFAKRKCSDSGKKEFLANMGCLTPEVKPKVDSHVNKFSSIVDYIAANVTKDAKFSWACCSYYAIMQAMTNEFEAQCSSLTAESSKYMKGALTSLVADIMEVACGKFNTIENCSKEAPATMAKLKELTAQPIDGSKASSMLRPLIKIAVSLDERS